LWRRHIEKTEPRPLRLIFWCAQVLQRPAGGSFTRVSIARVITTALVALALVALAAGCGGDEPKSEEDRAGDVAKEYVATHANNEREKCVDTLADGVSPKLCDDLGPLASRINPELEEAKVTGTTAAATVTGAGNNTRIDVSLVKEDDGWKVKSWKGRAVPPGS
jgi:hypothetical protein